MKLTDYGRKWIYQGRRVNTQMNAGGGALSIRLSIASGQIAILRSLRAIGPASVGATLNIRVLDEDSAIHNVLSVLVAGADNNVHLPAIGTAPSATSNLAQSSGIILAPGQYLAVNASAALQTETLTVAVTLELFNLETEPTWDTTGSTGTPSLAASTISTANTLQRVRE